jgi:hypothetical protein
MKRHYTPALCAWTACGLLILTMLLSTSALAHADTGDSPNYSDNGNAILALFAGLVAAPFILAGLFLALCGVVSAAIANSKGRSGIGFFVLAFLLGPLAIMTAILAAPIRRDTSRPAWAGIADLAFGVGLSRRLQGNRRENDQ